MNLDERASAAIVVSRQWADRWWANHHRHYGRGEQWPLRDDAYPVVVARIFDLGDPQGLWIERESPSHPEDFAAPTDPLFIPWSDVLSIVFDEYLVAAALGGPRPSLRPDRRGAPHRNAWRRPSSRRPPLVGRLTKVMAPVLVGLGLASGVAFHESSFDESAVRARVRAPLRDIAFAEEDAHAPRGLQGAPGPQLLMLTITGLCLMKIGRVLRSGWVAADEDASAERTTLHPTDGARI